LFGERRVSETTLNEIRDRYNLDDPFFVQYGKYMGFIPDDEDGFSGILQGNFGEDFRGREVTEIVGQRFPPTLRLAAGAVIVEAVIGVLAGVLAAIRRNSFLDSLVLVTTTLLVAVPLFVLASVAQLLFGVRLGWFPIAGINDGAISYALPIIMLATISLAYTARLTRTSMVENMRSDYVRTARAKGLANSRVVGRHVLRNSLIPVVTFLGVDFGQLLGGAVITETIFNIPGLGRAVFEAVTQREGAVVVGIVTLFVLAYLVANLVVDLLYGVLDPRIRYE
ncbi:MAG TPA: ABC transporter permease, partial [Euzebyales bacterium]|nr:ABC transporter permease [Euzebyales bacterium]